MEEVLHKTADPIKVKLIKGQKDAYGWEISVQGNNPDEILGQVDALDKKLRIGWIPISQGGE